MNNRLSSYVSFKLRISHIVLTLLFLFPGTLSFGNQFPVDINPLSSQVLSLPAKAGEKVKFSFTLKNECDAPQTFYFGIKKIREIASSTILSDSVVTLRPQEEYKGTLEVMVSDRIPVGGYETIGLFAENREHNKVHDIQFVAVRSTPHPFLLVTDDIIEETKLKIEKYDWAKENYEQMLKSSREYKIPERKVVSKKRNTREWESFNYSPGVSTSVFEMALAWKLSGDTSLRDKVAQFVKDVCDKDEGYINVGAATTGVQVHEGGFFMYLAATCDLLHNEPVLSEADHENIALTFRYFLKQNREHMNSIGIMNHQASANAGAILAALFMQDLAEVDYLTHAGGGMVDQISKGTMADGWWFESTVNYSYLVTGIYSIVAQAYENYGWDLYHRRFPVKFKSKDFDNIKEGFTGMKFDNWGPTGKNTIGLEEMYSAYVPLMDENAVVVSSNDSKATGPHRFYELAYRKFRKDEIAWVLNHANRESWEALVYGVPEIPEVEDPRSKSDYKPNVGLVALRSQQKNRTAGEQIQAYMKYGTHGGWHGHFDRASLIALDRYGHKYFGTEMAWYGYGQPGYKECVQTSATHNMVVVDELQQEAVPSEQLLFHAGDMMQVSVVQTIARWRKIPTFNISLFPPWDDKEYDPDFTPIVQRRLGIVTDDYMVVADFMKSDQEHTYDLFIHPIGLKSIEGATKRGEVLDSVSRQFDSPYKYFTDGQWYKISKGAKLQFEDDKAKLDVHTLWPRKADVLVANYPRGDRHQDIRNNPGRRSYAVRTKANEALFLTVLEPYKGLSAIKKIKSSSPTKLTVYLKDGRVQNINISNWQGNGTGIEVSITESKDGNEVRMEKTE